MRTSIIPILLAVALFSTSTTGQNVPQSINELIQSHSKNPVSESAPIISKALSSVYIPTPTVQVEGSTQKQFLTGQDNKGRIWLYIYSDKDNVSKVFPNGIDIVTVDITGLEQIIEANSFFRGIYLNSSYPIPSEVFDIFFNAHKDG